MKLNQFSLIFLGVIPMAAMAAGDPALDIGLDTPVSELHAPAQDQGMPYTRSARAAANEAMKDHRVFSAHSRYANFYGKRVRMLSQNPLEGEAMLIAGDLHVPMDFASAVLTKRELLEYDEPAPEIVERFVYTVSCPDVPLPQGVSVTEVRGVKYVSLKALAEAAGIHVTLNERGLAILGENPPKFEGALLDTVISSFDTPDTLTDPEITRNYIPLLKRQGKWTDFVKHTPEQIKMLEGPEHEWPLTSPEEFNLEGFDPTMLGSKVPPPGIYPRLLFSPEDLPMIRERMEGNRIMQRSFIELDVILNKTWLNPENPSGKLFERLVNGGPLRLDEMVPGEADVPLPRTPWKLKDQQGRFYSSHINHNHHAMVAIAWYALLKDDDALGKRVAKAISNYAHVTEILLDRYNETSDSEWGVDTDRAIAGETGWRGVTATVAHMQLPFELDFAGKWMTAEQKDQMRRIISKATYGRADSHSAGSIRWQENNHTTWHTTIGMAQMAIEGLPGHDVECEARNLRTIRGFLEYGIDPFGVVYESNGKSGAGFHFQTLNMIGLARRGYNTFGHPHWRKLMEAQMACTSPNGLVTATSGTYSGGKIEPMVTSMYRTFYPESKSADFILSSHFPDVNPETFDLKAYREKLEKDHGRTRLPVVGNPVHFFNTLYDCDWKVTKRADVPFTGDFNDTRHGILSTYNDQTNESAWLLMQVRAQHYVGAGHHHADPGLFYFAADGINWITESPITTYYHGYLHNNVLIDGISMANGPAARGKYLGAEMKPGGAFATTDITNAYDWRWTTQVVLWDEGGWWCADAPTKLGYEFEPDPEVIQAFKGTQHRKMRIWWASYNFSNWFPTVRAPYNPVEHAYRSVGLVKGDRPYALIVDDVKKDDLVHQYQWTAATGDRVWTSEAWSRDKERMPNHLILAHEAPFANDTVALVPRHHGGKQSHIRPKEGDPQLLVCFLNYDPEIPAGEDPRDTGVLPLMELRTSEGPRDHRGLKQQFYDQVVINQSHTEGEYKVLLLPFKAGEELPKISYDHEKLIATIQWPDQTDEIVFTLEGNRTRTKVLRDGKEVAISK